MTKRAKEVLQFSASNNRFIKKWNSISEAAKALGIHHSQISRVVRGEYSQAQGFVWMSLDEYNRRKAIFK